MCAMTTKRSLNKLERKAHMNIHNTMEVVEGEMHPDACYTRDRFGKKQEINKDSRPFRLRPNKVSAAALLLLSITALTAWADAAPAPEPKKRNTDIQIESSHEDLSFLNQENKKKERFRFYSDQKASIDINEDGDPNLNMRF